MVRQTPSTERHHLTLTVSPEEMTELTKGMPRGLARMLQSGRSRFHHAGRVYQCAPASSQDDSFIRQNGERLELVEQVAIEPTSPAAARDANPLREAHSKATAAAEAVRDIKPAKPNQNPLQAADARLKGRQ